MTESTPAPKRPAAPSVAVHRPNPRAALGLEEMLELLAREELLDAQQVKEIESRATTLRSMVLKERVGSVRSHAAARYDVSPAEVVAAASFPHPKKKHGLKWPANPQRTWREPHAMDIPDEASQLLALRRRARL